MWPTPNRWNSLVLYSSIHNNRNGNPQSKKNLWYIRSASTSRFRESIGRNWVCSFLTTELHCLLWLEYLQPRTCLDVRLGRRFQSWVNDRFQKRFCEWKPRTTQGGWGLHNLRWPSVSVEMTRLSSIVKQNCCFVHVFKEGVIYTASKNYMPIFYFAAFHFSAFYEISYRLWTNIAWAKLKF